VRTPAPGAFGDQVITDAFSSVALAHAIFSPTAGIGCRSEVGEVVANSIHNHGSATGELSPFPAAKMPLLPFVGGTQGGADVSVGVGDVTALSPGEYGALRVAANGTLVLL